MRCGGNNNRDERSEQEDESYGTPIEDESYGTPVENEDDNEDDEDSEEFFDAEDHEDDSEESTGEKWCDTSFPSCIPFHSRLGHRIDCIQLGSPGKKVHLQKTLAYQLFRGRLVMYKLNLTKNQGDVPVKYIEEANGYQYEILCSKLEMNRQENIPKKILTLFYILTNGGLPDYPAINLQQRLDNIANFGGLLKTKIASRLELLFSTAVDGKGKDGLAIYTDLTIDDFEEIPEHSNVGCGFIPRQYLERFFGRKQRGTSPFAVQVRIFSPKLGVFKGMLMEKPGIQKIQLPPSMKKIGPSLSNNSNTSVTLLVNNVYPTKNHTQVAKVLKDGVANKSWKPNKLKWMITSLLESLGVPRETMQEYVNESYQPQGRGLQHSCLIGVADPTDSIPPGHIFVTGVLGTDADLDNLLTTRFPCSQKQDVLMLPLITTRPETMTSSHWDFLCNLPFAAVVMGNAPAVGQPSLPVQIARGDLDGDYYFICWNKKILQCIQPAMPAPGEWDDGILEEICPPDSAWLQNVQESTLSNVSRLARLLKLIGMLCTARKRLLKDCGPDCASAEALGSAYKDANEVGKHDKKVRLPRALWGMLPECLHDLLVDNAAMKSCEDNNCPTRTFKRTAKSKTRTPSRQSTESANATEDKHNALDGLQEGAPVEIIGGTYQTKTATFLRLTAKMVYVRIGEQPLKEIRISQKHVRPG